MSDSNINNYDDIDFRLNMLFDCVYNKNTKNCYIFEPIVKANIKLNNIIQSKEYDLSELFDAELKYMGTYNNRVHFKRISKTSYPCTLSIGVYRYKAIHDMGKEALVNSGISYILSEFLLETYKNILLPIMHCNITRDKLKKLSKSVYEKVNEFDNDEKYHDALYIYITEHYFKTETLREYLENVAKNKIILEKKHWQSLFFQLFYILYKISIKMKNFRHNKLNLDSIRLFRLEESNDFIYTLGDIKFKVPNVGFEVRITDFDYSYTTDYIGNIKNKSTFKTTYNPYYDINYILNLVYLFLKDNKMDINMDNLKPLLKDILPERFRHEKLEDFKIYNGLNEDAFDKYSSSIIIPIKVLKTNNFFTELIIE
jgi:hypothetical protein